MPNHQIPILEPEGIEQAKAVGVKLGSKFLSEALLYQSPYTRTRQTMKGILSGAGFNENNLPKIYEDPRLREVDFGYGDPEAQKPKRAHEGYFWYRMDGGESAADCFDRTSDFLDSMMRQLERKQKEVYEMPLDDDAIIFPEKVNRDVVIVTHGMIIRCFVMRFLHLTVEQFDATDTPGNCDVITIAPRELIENPQFTSGKWAVEGLTMRA
jgi:broad specificity phosphatase PhoE